MNMYSYVRNNPLIAIDPGGLLTVIIPGTGYNASTWSNSGAASDFISSVSGTFNETHSTQVINDKSVWSGGDNSRARQAAANNITNMINNYSFAEGEQLNIVGHSHGGNVAALVSQGVNRNIDNLVTLGTPVRSDYQPNYDMIGSHINAYSNSDLVQRLGGGQTSVSGILGRMFLGRVGASIGDSLSIGEFGLAGREFQGATNIDVTSSQNGNAVSAHSNLWNDSGAWSQVSKELE